MHRPHSLVLLTLMLLTLSSATLTSIPARLLSRLQQTFTKPVPKVLKNSLSVLHTLTHIPARTTHSSTQNAPQNNLASLLSPLTNLLRVTSDLPTPAYALQSIDPIHRPRSALILLHGLGRTPADWGPYIPFLRAQLPHTRLLLPQANTHHVSGIPGPDRPSWFDIPSVQPDGPEAAEEIIRAAQNVADIARIQCVAHGIAPQRIAVAGLSQGGALALTAYMRHAFAACVSISGWLPLAKSYPASMNAKSHAPSLLVHGDRDEILPVLAGRLSAQALRSYGRNTSYVEFEGDGHLVVKSFDVVVDRMVAVLKESIGTNDIDR